MNQFGLLLSNFSAAGKGEWGGAGRFWKMREKLSKVNTSACTEGLDSRLIQCIVERNAETWRGSRAGLV